MGKNPKKILTSSINPRKNAFKAFGFELNVAGTTDFKFVKYKLLGRLP